MRGRSLVVAGLVLTLAPTRGGHAETAPTLAHAVVEYQEGRLDAAVLMLDAMTRAAPVGKPPEELARVHVYKGAALVGLAQEEPAKASFRAALALDPELRLKDGEFPDRVERVFEAARKGRTSSVMQRPTGGPAKKAGMGAGTVALIVGGIAAAGGAAAVAASGGAPNTAVANTNENATGLDITLVDSSPASGSTITGCGPSNATCPSLPRVTFRVRSTAGIPAGTLDAFLNNPSSTCLKGSVSVAGGGTDMLVTVDFRGSFSGASTCATPFQINALNLFYGNYNRTFSVSYGFAP